MKEISSNYSYEELKSIFKKVLDNPSGDIIMSHLEEVGYVNSTTFHDIDKEMSSMCIREGMRKMVLYIKDMLGDN